MSSSCQIYTSLQILPHMIGWLVVWTPLKNMSQLGWLFHIIPNIWKFIKDHKLYKSHVPVTTNQIGMYPYDFHPLRVGFQSGRSANFHIYRRSHLDIAFALENLQIVADQELL